MLASIVWYAGGGLALAGCLLLIRPIRWLGVPTRRRAGALAILGILLAIISVSTGGATRRIGAPTTLLDQFVPAFQFNETHAIEIDAPDARVYRALLEVTAEEITLFRTLTWIRRAGRSSEPSLLNPPARTPILETALRSGFRKLAERPNVEIVLGTFVVAPAGAASRRWTPEAFATLEEPGFARAAMNFLVEPRGARACRLRTETRVYATDAVSRRQFMPYWRTIYPGSAIIRRMWLKAVKTRAEKDPTT